MRDLVIVLADLYLSAEPDPSRERGRKVATNPPSPETVGLDTLARFGTRTSLSHGWRHEAARAIGFPKLAPLAPASIASAATLSGAEVTAPAGARTVWLATPLFLAAGLTTLHLDRRSILRLSSAELASVTGEFNRTFDGSGFTLVPLESGEALLFAAEDQVANTVEPARIVGEDVASALPDGQGASALKRLGAEMELWLHDHPLNRARTARGEAPISTLWIWGGASLAETAAAVTPGVLAAPAKPSGVAAAAAPSGVAAAATPSALPGAVPFGSDSTLNGLARMAGIESHPLPDTLDQALGYSSTANPVVVMEVGPVLRANPRWTLADAIADLDRRFLEPAIRAVRRGVIGQAALIANDRRFEYGSRDHLRLWRRPRAGLEALR